MFKVNECKPIIWLDAVGDTTTCEKNLIWFFSWVTKNEKKIFATKLGKENQWEKKLTKSRLGKKIYLFFFSELIAKRVIGCMQSVE